MKRIDRTLHTNKGNSIQRTNKYIGIGKQVDNCLYFHSDYARQIIPTEIYESAIKKLTELSGVFYFNCVRWNFRTNEVRFDEAFDFDISHEPRVGVFININPDGRFNQGDTASIWHHKWMWVADDYAGFDVEASFQRSAQWVPLDPDFQRIGHRGYWREWLAQNNLPV